MLNLCCDFTNEFSLSFITKKSDCSVINKNFRCNALPQMYIDNESIETVLMNAVT